MVDSSKRPTSLEATKQLPTHTIRHSLHTSRLSVDMVRHIAGGEEARHRGPAAGHLEIAGPEVCAVPVRAGIEGTSNTWVWWRGKAVPFV